MIPIRDINPTRTKPVVTYSVIAACVGVFLIEVVAGEAGMRGLVWRFGLIPEILAQGDFTNPRSMGGARGALITPLTSLFMHASWLHLLGNMWFLHVFGDNVEDALGRWRFALFFLGTGLAAAATQILMDPSSRVPMIGASGAVSGVLGAYVLLYPHARVVTFVPLLFIELPAFVFVFVWFALQVFGLSAALGQGGGAGIAWSAHVGGFIAGLVFVLPSRERIRASLRPGSTPGEVE
ncbi:MAG: rhomboid family intramembrane serine protease [Myxococcales bacterium]|nr:rhomboid family intramembrane serine protease [Myxococcales bacterium]